MDPVEQSLQILKQVLDAAYKAGVIADINSSIALNQAFDIICKTCKPAAAATAPAENNS